MRVGIVGYGTSGKMVASALTKGAVPGMQLAAVSTRNLGKARDLIAEIDETIHVVPLEELADYCDTVVETATGEAIPEIVAAVVGKGKDLICVSAGGFINVPDVEEFARRHGARIHIASGAIPGLDILRSASEGEISRVHLKTTVKPDSLVNEPYLIEKGMDFRSKKPSRPVQVFHGRASEAAKFFPRHLNVAVSVSLAGIGFERTTIELWLDPKIPGVVHLLEVEGENIGLTLESRNRPSSNRKTSRIVAPSILAALRSYVATIRVGS
jgi:aspartate dehydrogenase